jgi:hypothetical protein
LSRVGRSRSSCRCCRDAGDPSLRAGRHSGPRAARAAVTQRKGTGHVQFPIALPPRPDDRTRPARQRCAPEGQSKIAQRFNAGIEASPAAQSPGGTTEGFSNVGAHDPLSRPYENFSRARDDAHPVLKHWAIVNPHFGTEDGRPLGTKAHRSIGPLPRIILERMGTCHLPSVR